MTRDIVQTLRTQEQMYRQMGNVRQGEILARAAEEIERLRELREAVRNTFVVYDRMAPSLKNYCEARAEVDRLIAEGDG